MYCRENNIEYEEVVGVQEWFPYPGEYMKKYLQYIKKEFDIKITWLDCDVKYWLEKNKGHHPRLPYPYCCRVKSEIICNYLKEEYGKEGITMILGIRRAESWKRRNYEDRGDWYWNKRFKVNYQYWYPIFQFIDAKHYCNIHGVKINPLYDIHGVRRLGCYKCYKVGDFRWKPKDEQQLILNQFL